MEGKLKEREIAYNSLLERLRTISKSSYDVIKTNQQALIEAGKDANSGISTIFPLNFNNFLDENGNYDKEKAKKAIIENINEIESKGYNFIIKPNSFNRRNYNIDDFYKLKTDQEKKEYFADYIAEILPITYGCNYPLEAKDKDGKTTLINFTISNFYFSEFQTVQTFFHELTHSLQDDWTKQKSDLIRNEDYLHRNNPTYYVEVLDGVRERKINYDSKYFDGEPTDDKINEAKKKFYEDYRENLDNLFYVKAKMETEADLLGAMAVAIINRNNPLKLDAIKKEFYNNIAFDIRHAINRKGIASISTNCPYNSLPLVIDFIEDIEKNPENYDRYINKNGEIDFVKLRQEITRPVTEDYVENVIKKTFDDIGFRVSDSEFVIEEEKKQEINQRYKTSSTPLKQVIDKLPEPERYPMPKEGEEVHAIIKLAGLFSNFLRKSNSLDIYEESIKRIRDGSMEERIIGAIETITRETVKEKSR